MIASMGSKGYRIRLRGYPRWFAVSERMFKRTVPRETRIVMARVRDSVRVLRPHVRASEVVHERTLAEFVDDDLVAVRCDVYIRVYDDLVHGWIRMVGVLQEDGRVEVTRWCRPRGHGWMPMRSGLEGSLWDELGWVYDLDDDVPESTLETHDDTH